MAAKLDLGALEATVLDRAVLDTSVIDSDPALPETSAEDKVTRKRKGCAKPYVPGQRDWSGQYGVDGLRAFLEDEWPRSASVFDARKLARRIFKELERRDVDLEDPRSLQDALEETQLVVRDRNTELTTHLPPAENLVGDPAEITQLVGPALQNGGELIHYLAHELDDHFGACIPDRGHLPPDALSIAIEALLEGILEGLTQSGVFTLDFLEELAAAHLENSAILNVFGPGVFNAGAFYGLGARLYGDVMGIVELLRMAINLEETIAAATAFIEAVLADETGATARELGIVIGLSLVEPVKQLPTYDPITYMFELGALIGPLLIDVLLWATGLELGSVVLKLLESSQLLRRLVSLMLKLIPDTNVPVRRLLETSLEPDDLLRWLSSRVDLSGDPAVIRAYERLNELEAFELLKQLRELVEDNVDVLDDGSELLDNTLMYDVLRAIDRLETDEQVLGLAMYERVFTGNDASVGRWTESLGAGERTVGKYQDTWTDLITDEAMAPYVDELLQVMGELHGRVDEDTLVPVLRDFLIGDKKLSGAMGSLYTARKLLDEFPHARISFEVPQGNRIIDVTAMEEVWEFENALVDDGETAILAPVWRKLVEGEVKALSTSTLPEFIAKKLKAQMVKDLVRTLGDGDFELKRIRYYVPGAQHGALEPEFADLLELALQDPAVVTAAQGRITEVSGHLQYRIAEGVMIQAYD